MSKRQLQMKFEWADLPRSWRKGCLAFMVLALNFPCQFPPPPPQ